MSKPLSHYSFYVTDKINSNLLTTHNYIGVDNMLPNKGGVVDSAYVPNTGSSIAFKKGDILIGNIRPYFKKIWLASFDGGCSPDVLCIRSNGLITPECLYAVLSQDLFFDYDMAGSKGSKMPRGDKNHIMSFPIPDLAGQESIGLFITGINEKININKRIINELELITKSLYEYWFMQFEFPNEEGKPYKSSGGKMVYNEELKREIPEGWENASVDEMIEKAPSLKAIKAPDYLNAGKYPIVDQADSLITGYTNDESFLYENKGGCVVFGDVTTYFKYINFPFAKGTDGTKIMIAKNNRIPPLLMFHILRHAELPNIGFARHYMLLRDYRFAVPSKTVCDEYDQFTKPMMDKRASLIKENQELVSLRDFLLPMLMNGQVTFK